jgi:methionyl-tRNA formyltransferase
MTQQNGLVDWSWTGPQIAAFCQAFDDPYLGAGTFCRGEEVRLKRASFEPGEPAGVHHPYVTGLIVRKRGGQVWAAVAGGLLRLDYVADACGKNLLPTLREGDRFVTPAEDLDRARTYSPMVKAT